MKDYAGEPFQFKVAGKPYVMQAIGFADIEKVVGLGETLKSDPQKGVDAIRGLILAKSNAKTADAVMAGLGPKQILELIKDWSGLTPGESETSGDE